MDRKGLVRVVVTVHELCVQHTGEWSAVEWRELRDVLSTLRHVVTAFVESADADAQGHSGTAAAWRDIGNERLFSAHAFAQRTPEERDAEHEAARERRLVALHLL